jgi:hypothetical protein
MRVTFYLPDGRSYETHGVPPQLQERVNIVGRGDFKVYERRFVLAPTDTPFCTYNAIIHLMAVK